MPNARYFEQANWHKFAKFKEGDLVCVHLCKDRFLTKNYGKLKPRTVGPFRIFKKIGENAYMDDLPADYEVSNSFNIADLFRLHEEDTNLRMFFFNQGSMMRGMMRIP